MPKTVTRVSRDGSVKFTNNVDAVQYTLNELTRAGLRDVGRFLAKNFRLSFYSHFKKINGAVSRGTGYTVYRKDPQLNIGVAKIWKGKVIGESAIPQELGNARTKQKRLSLLRNTVYNNISTIIEIESQYLSELSKDVPKIKEMSENEYEE